MVSFPPCKINLGLNILSKRTDGYHNLSTCFYPIPWTDIIEIIPADELSFTNSGLVIPGRTEDNLCLKAYQLLRKDFDLPLIKIHLHKIIPTGAGLGGGSSDAAYMLRLLNDIFQLKISAEGLTKYTSLLGSDCAFFLQDKPQLGSWRGEILSPIQIDLRGKFIALVKPDINVSTAEAYSGVVPKNPAIAIQEILERYTISQWRDILVNDFEDSVFKKHPVIKKLKQKMYRVGAIYASMSGSGSSIYGIFEKEIDVRKEFTDAICWSGII